MNTYTKLLLLAIPISFVLACDRAANSTSTKISIQLPAALATTSLIAGKSEVSTSAIDNNGSISSNDWATSSPVAVSSFNCYMAIISGPENLLNRNRCGKKTTAQSSLSGLSTIVTFGPMAGAVPAGQSLDIEVASGADRVITLIGFQVLEPADIPKVCVDFNSVNFDRSKVSKPYILGSSAKMELKPTVGDEYTSVPITMAYSAGASLDDCEGPDFTRASQTPAQVSIKKSFFPSNLTAVEKCTPLDIEIHDNTGRATTSSTDTVLKIIDGVSTAVSTYSSYTNCHNSTGIATSFVISSGTSSVQRWYLSNATAGTSGFFALDTSQTNLTKEQSSVYVPNVIATKNKIDIVGPAIVAPEVCYKYDVSFRPTTGSYYSPDPSTHVFISTPETATVYTNATCSSQAVAVSNAAQGITHGFDFIMTGLTADAKKVFYVKYAAGSEYKNILSAYDAAFNGVNIQATLTYFVVPTTDLTPVATIIREDKLLPAISSSCFGPFRLALVNASGVEVPAPSGATGFNFSSTGSATSTKLAATCTSSSMSNVAIDPGSSAASFYIVTTIVAASSAQYTMIDTNKGPTFNTIFKFTFN